MGTINYKIKFFSDWHCGSGLSAGADVDMLVVKDKKGLPFVPGKTMKGLIKEAVEDVMKFRTEETSFSLKSDWGYFENAVLSSTHQEAILSNAATEYLFHSIASTAIEKEGVAKRYSLRKMQVVIPCELEGRIVNVPDEGRLLIETGMRFIKRMGQNRNRGLGRCQFIIEEGGQHENASI